MKESLAMLFLYTMLKGVPSRLLVNVLPIPEDLPELNNLNDSTLAFRI